MALRYLVDLPRALFQIVFCVDSKSVLNSLKSSESKVRAELILEIRHAVNSLILRGTDVSFCWVPSHCGISSNDWVDRAAKKGAQNDGFSEKVTIPFSVQEGYSLLEKGSYSISLRPSNNRYCEASNLSSKIYNIESNLNIVSAPCFYSRAVISLFFRFRLNALKTKFNQNIKCICGNNLDIIHILFRCQPLRQFLPSSFTDHTFSLQEDNFFAILQNTSILCDLVRSLVKSPIVQFL